MQPNTPITCPAPDCDALAVVAGEEEMLDGRPMWRCSAGHQGPRLTGSPRHR